MNMVDICIGIFITGTYYLYFRKFRSDAARTVTKQLTVHRLEGGLTDNSFLAFAYARGVCIGSRHPLVPGAVRLHDEEWRRDIGCGSVDRVRRQCAGAV